MTTTYLSKHYEKAKDNLIDLCIQHYKTVRFFHKKRAEITKMRKVHKVSGILVTYRVYWTKRTGMYGKDAKLPYFINLLTVTSWKRLKRIPKRQTHRAIFGASAFELLFRAKAKFLYSLKNLQKIKDRLDKLTK